MTKLITKRVRYAKQLSPIGSHIGGWPYFEAGDLWPQCIKCHCNLDFICQIDYSTGTHIKIPNIDLFTLFYCWHCMPGDGNNKDQGQWLMKCYANPSIDKAIKIDMPNSSFNRLKPCELIIVAAWKNTETFLTGFSERLHVDMGVFDHDIDIDADFNDAKVRELIRTNIDNIANNMIPTCSICGQKESFLAQIGSEAQAGLMWGDGGRVYLFCCETHLDDKQIIFQCY